MKKYAVFSLCLIILLSFCSCKPEGITMPDGSMLYTQTNISNKKSLEFKDEGGNILLDEKDVAWVYEKYSDDIGYHLIVELTGSGAVEFSKVTRKNIGKEISLFADGENIFNAMVMAEITDGKFVIAGKASNYSELSLLAKKITG